MLTVLLSQRVSIFAPSSATMASRNDQKKAMAACHAIASPTSRLPRGLRTRRITAPTTR